MKAVQINQYGGIDVLEINQNTTKPKASENQILVEVYVAVFDTAGNEVTDRSFQILKQNGIIVSMLGQPNQQLAKKFNVTAVGQNTKTNSGHLNRLREFIDKIFNLDQIREAFIYQEKNHPKGKVVIRIKN